jgi:adenine-specific DNA-methyltransferase
MAKRPSAPKTQKKVETLRHPDDKRLNIPTAEHQSVLEAEHLAHKEVRYPRNIDLDPQLVWRGKDYQDWSDLVVQAPPLYIQDKVHPKVLVDDLLRESKGMRAQESGDQIDLFADFNGVAEGADRTDFYQHDQNWTNRMVLGDSLQVMASLAEREGLRGRVQCIYIDPPYGIKFNSNFQWSTTSRDVKDGNAGHITLVIFLRTRVQSSSRLATRMCTGCAPFWTKSSARTTSVVRSSFSRRQARVASSSITPTMPFCGMRRGERM